LIISEDGGWANEDTFAERGWLIDQGIVLNFAVISEGDTATDISAAANDAIFTEDHAIADLG
jgi:hypothetical protein